MRLSPRRQAPRSGRSHRRQRCPVGRSIGLRSGGSICGRRAGIGRSGSPNDATRKHITFHDLKATAGTWMALRGDNPLTIMQRLAHRDLKTTLAYVRSAEMLGLPRPRSCRFSARHQRTAREYRTQGLSAENLAEPPGIESTLALILNSATSLVSRARSMRSKAVSPVKRVGCSPRESPGVVLGLGDTLETEQAASQGARLSRSAPASTVFHHRCVAAPETSCRASRACTERCSAVSISERVP